LGLGGDFSNSKDSDASAGNDSEGSDGSDGNDHHCVWYDKCGPDPDFNDNVHTLNCAYEGKASKPISFNYGSYSGATTITITTLNISAFSITLKT